MPVKFQIEDFEPKSIRRAKENLKKHIKVVEERESKNKEDAKSIKISTWQKFLNLFRYGTSTY